jgi:hypothetical protein
VKSGGLANTGMVSGDDDLNASPVGDAEVAYFGLSRWSRSPRSGIQNSYVCRHVQRLLRLVCRVVRNTSMFQFNHAGDAQADQQHCHDQADHKYHGGPETEFPHLATT